MTVLWKCPKGHEKQFFAQGYGYYVSPDGEQQFGSRPYCDECKEYYYELTKAKPNPQEEKNADEIVSGIAAILGMKMKNDSVWQIRAVANALRNLAVGLEQVADKKDETVLNET